MHRIVCFTLMILPTVVFAGPGAAPVPALSPHLNPAALAKLFQAAAPAQAPARVKPTGVWTRTGIAAWVVAGGEGQEVHPGADLALTSDGSLLYGDLAAHAVFEIWPEDGPDQTGTAVYRSAKPLSAIGFFDDTLYVAEYVPDGRARIVTADFAREGTPVTARFSVPEHRDAYATITDFTVDPRTGTVAAVTADGSPDPDFVYAVQNGRVHDAGPARRWDDVSAVAPISPGRAILAVREYGRLDTTVLIDDSGRPIAGDQELPAPGPCNTAGLAVHEGLAYYVTPESSHIYRVDIETGAVETIAGGLNRPSDLVFDTAASRLYVAEANRILALDLTPDGKAVVAP